MPPAWNSDSVLQHRQDKSRVGHHKSCPEDQKIGLATRDLFSQFCGSPAHLFTRSLSYNTEGSFNLFQNTCAAHGGFEKIQYNLTNEFLIDEAKKGIK